MKKSREGRQKTRWSCASTFRPGRDFGKLPTTSPSHKWLGYFQGQRARRRKRPPGRARSPAMSQPGGLWQFGVDERGKGRLKLRAYFACRGKAVEGHRTPKRLRDTEGHRTARSVLECASPLALWAGATPETATGTGALPSNVPAGRPMAVWGGRTGQRAFEYQHCVEMKP